MALAAAALPDSARMERLPSRILNDMGRKALDACNPSEALLPLSIVARRYYEKPGDPGRRRAAVTAMHWLGVYYMRVRLDQAKSYEYTATAIAIAEEDGLTAELPNLYCNMGALHLGARLLGTGGSSRSVNEYLKKAYRMAAATGNTAALLTTVDNMVQLSATSDFIPELTDFQRRRLPSTPAVAYTRCQAAAHEALAGGDTLLAVERLKASADMEEYADAGRGRGALLKSAELLISSGRQRQSRDLLRRVLGSAERQADTTSMVWAYQCLAESYDISGMADSARDARYRWYELREQARLGQEHDLEATGLALQVERVNQDLKAMSLTRRKRERQLLWGAALLAVMLAVAGWLYTSRRSQQRHLRELYEQNGKLLDALEARRAETPAKEKYQASPVDAEMSDELYRRAEHTLATDPRVFDADFSLEKLAAALDINPRYLSQAVNSHGATFPSMLAAVRIQEACRRFRDTAAYGRLTIEAVARSVGMSYSSFGTLFKKATGMTPFQYRRQAEREAEEL